MEASPGLVIARYAECPFSPILTTLYFLLHHLSQLKYSRSNPWYPEFAGNVSGWSRRGCNLQKLGAIFALIFCTQTDNWATGYLQHALQHARGGELPWRGPELGEVSPDGVNATESYPWLDRIVPLLRAETAASNHVHLPVKIPYEMARLAHPKGVGTRMIFSIRGT